MIIMWKTIPDFPDYEIGSDNRVRCIKSGKFLTPVFDERSRMAVVLRRNGALHCVAVNKLARSVFSTT